MKHPLLFLSQCLPYPPHSGVTNRTYNILRQIAQRFDVRLIAFFRKNHQRSPEALATARSALEALGVRVLATLPIRSERANSLRLVVHGASLLSRRPYTFHDYWQVGAGRIVSEALRTSAPALIHMDSLDLHRFLQLARGVPVACTHHSIESELLRLRARQVESFALRWYLHRQADAVERVERAECGLLALNVMMSDVDGRRLQELVPGAPVVTIPNGVDTDQFRPLPADLEVPGRVAFLGPSYMFPNRDAVEYFLGAIWPLVLHHRPDASFEVIGKVARDHAQAWERAPRVHCAGYVPDVRPHLAAAACCVVPIRIGGGTRLKILDAWAMGRPVVSTSVGCEGLAANEGRNIVIRDDAESFADAVVRVLGDRGLRQELGTAARLTAESTYSWDRIGASLADAYGGIVREGANSVQPVGDR